MLHGIDISQHNGLIDPRYYDHDFVMIRAGWSDNADTLFERHCKTCEQYGIPYGVYWYSYALTPSSAREEAEACLRLIKDKKISVGVWFDMEDADHWKKNNGWDMSKRNISNICNAFCEIIEGAGYYAGIYASLSWLTGSGQVIDCPKYDKWVAHWKEPIPDHSNLGSVLQYSDKPVDRDLIYGDLARYQGKKKMKTFDEFYKKYLGKAPDDDGAYGCQCVDLFRVFCREFGVPVKPTPNNYADGYWLFKDELGYAQYFDFITDPKQYQKGDVVIWVRGSRSHPSSHIAFFVPPNKEFGTNQGGDRSACVKVTDFSDALGALRLKAWNEPYTGWKKQNGRWYYLRRDERLTGWQKLKWSGGYDWFFFRENGVMVTGLQWLEWKGVSQWYYFSPRTGAMQTGDVMLTLNFGKSGKLTGEAKV